MSLQKTDPEIYNLIKGEEQRLNDVLEMIPSENFVSKSVREAVGSVLMNKYAEGQAFKRFYQGNEFVDQVEALTKKRALEAYGLNPEEWGVNVQAVTGSVGNLAVYNALINPGDKIFGMFLYDGGHLSHGWKMPYDGKKVSFTSVVYDSYFYYVDEKTELFNYDEIEKQALTIQPKIIISGGTAYPREIDHERLRAIADKIQAYYMADIAHESGLVLAGVNKSPFPYAHVVTMTTRKTLRGPIGAMIFSRKEFSDKIDSAVFPGLQGGPQEHSIAGIGVALHEASQPEFKKYAAQVVKNAQTLAKALVEKGYHVLTGGTDKHLVLIDMRNKNINGTEVALALEEANIVINKNTVPKDTSKPWRPSGIRLGTPAITTRGMKEEDMEKIAEWIDVVIKESIDLSKDMDMSVKAQREELSGKFKKSETIKKIQKEVLALCHKFPLE
jgi:glycine hydroxymethyltransferase